MMGAYSVLFVAIAVVLIAPRSVWSSCSHPYNLGNNDFVIIDYSFSFNDKSSVNCSWRFRKVEDVIRVEIINFDLYGDSSDCYSGNTSYVEILSASNQFISLTHSAGRWCGKISSATVEVLTDVTIEFKAYNWRPGETFKIRVSHHELHNNGLLYCNKEKWRPPVLVYPGSPVYIYSPGYPVKYPNDIFCHWEVRAIDSGSVVLAKVVNLQIESEYDCDFDRVTFKGTARDPLVLCGVRHSLNVQSTGNTLSINFTSDSTVEYNGFFLKIYTSTALKELKAAKVTSVFTIPENLIGLPVHLTWRISAEQPNHVVNVTVVNNNPSSSSLCGDTHIDFFDGFDEKSRKIGDVCEGDVFLSTQKYMYVRLVTERLSIFRVEYKAVEDDRPPEVPDIRLPAFPDTRLPAFPDTRLPAFPDIRLPTYPDRNLPTFPNPGLTEVPDARVTEDSDLSIRTIWIIAGSIFGAVMVIFTGCFFYYARHKKSSSSSSSASPSSPSTEPAVVNSHNNSVFVTNAIYMGERRDAGSSPAAMPRPHPDILNQVYVETPGESPPPYSSLGGYQLTRIHSQEFLVPVQGCGLEGGLRLTSPVPPMRQTPEASRDEYAEPADPPQNLPPPSSPPPPSYESSCSENSQPRRQQPGTSRVDSTSTTTTTAYSQSDIPPAM